MDNLTTDELQQRSRRPTLPADFEHRMVWWKEALIISAFYSVYTLIRNQFGSTLVKGISIPEHAFTNAVRVIRFERWLGLFHEETIQEWFLPHVWFIKTMNVYYGTAHFFVTLAVFVALYKLRPSVFGQWRNTLAVMTTLAIIGFSLFPLMPPRLLDAPCPDAGFGAQCIVGRQAKSQINTLQCLRCISVGQCGVHSGCGRSPENFGCAPHYLFIRA